MLATAAWIGLVLWRVSRQPRAFWRPMALSSGGMVLTWFLLMTLWLPAGELPQELSRSGRAPPAKSSPPKPAASSAMGLDVAQRALLAYYANARFIRLPRLDGNEPMADAAGTAAGCWCRTARACRTTSPR